MKRGWNNRHFFFLEILFQGQGTARRIVQIKDYVLVDEIFKISFSYVVIVLIVTDRALDFVVTQHLGVVDKVEVILDSLGVRIAGIGSRTGDGKRQPELVHLAGMRMDGKGCHETSCQQKHPLVHIVHFHFSSLAIGCVPS
ncbi:MAG: hypothetical protein ACD_75C00046G0002 [uncultured bacterium]|nr:MAG: hypothetical protein ACD_75C00046G0002 [uncultured bacterium]